MSGRSAAWHAHLQAPYRTGAAMQTHQAIHHTPHPESVDLIEAILRTPSIQLNSVMQMRPARPRGGVTGEIPNWTAALVLLELPVDCQTRRPAVVRNARCVRSMRAADGRSSGHCGMWTTRCPDRRQRRTINQCRSTNADRQCRYPSSQGDINAESGFCQGHRRGVG